MDWEIVTANLDRIVVPGGWLYRTRAFSSDGTAVAMCFVPATATRPPEALETTRPRQLHAYPNPPF